jgi:hypothetical protein
MTIPVPAPVPFFRMPSGCDLIDIGCHAQSAVWEAWSLQSWPVKALIIIGLLAVVLGAARGFLALLHRIGGWPAVIGAVLAILGLVLAVLPKKPRRDDEPAWTNGEPGEKPVKRYRVPPRRKPSFHESLTRQN